MRQGSRYNAVDNDGRGKGAQGTKATVVPKKIIVVLKKTTAASKKNLSKKKISLHNKFDESEREQEHKATGSRITKGVVIRDTMSAPVKKAIASSKKLKVIDLLSAATQFEIDTQKAATTSQRASRFQHKASGSSEGTGIAPGVETIGKYAVSDEGASTLPKVPNETKDKRRGKGAQGTKETVVPKKIIVVPKKTTAASKKNLSKKKISLHNKFDESEREQEHKATGSRITKGVVIRD
nr:hypothetical protein [Tanacetum cinerariifolium]